MKTRSNDLITRFCNYLGRNNLFSAFLDFLTFQFMDYAYEFNRKPEKIVKAKKSSLIEKYVLKITLPPWLTTNRRKDIIQNFAKAPYEPHISDTPKGDCNQKKYRGLHGAPCSFAGATDKHCPKSAVIGWFWSYTIHGLGEIFYVDCCGGTITPHTVHCNWKNEPNWCKGTYSLAKNTTYNCTLVLTKAEMESRIQIEPKSTNWTLKD